MQLLTVILVLIALAIKADSTSSDRFYASRSLYEGVYEYLDQSDHLPDSFGPRKLEAEHRDLIANSCEPIVFYFFGRHGARFPSAKDIKRGNDTIAELKKKVRRNAQCASTRVPGGLEVFLNWVPKMEARQDKLMSWIGGYEEQKIARRFRKLYPQFFDASKSEIKIGVTSDVRTAQTAVEFLKEIDNLYWPNCHPETLPTNNHNSPYYHVDEIRGNACYLELMRRCYVPILEFHRLCQQISGKVKYNEPEVERVERPIVVERIVGHINEKLGFSQLKDPNLAPVNSDVLTIIFDMCRFELAIGEQSSAWCSLLEKRDLDALEFIEDVNNYVKVAYGPNANPTQSCVLISDLLEAMEKGQVWQSGASSDEEAYTKRRSYFYFSHEAPLKKLYAAFGLFKDATSFNQANIEKFARDLLINQNQQWKTSLISPFSANMAFILYRCKEPRGPFSYKIITTVNERPVKLAGCSDVQCSSEEFSSKYNEMRGCDLKKVCAKKQS